MTSYRRDNIDTIHELTKNQVGEFLSTHGYKLTRQEHNEEGIETRLTLWTNTSKNHGIQLIWDSKEQWLNLVEYESLEEFNPYYAKNISVVPVKIMKLFSFDKYARKIADSIKNDLVEKLSIRQ